MSALFTHPHPHAQSFADIAVFETCTTEPAAQTKVQQVAGKPTITLTTAAIESGVEPVATQEAEQLTQALITNSLGENSASTESVCTRLGALVSLRESWETTELAASHSRLYEILRSCYQFYLHMKSKEIKKVERDRISKELDMFIRQRGLRTLAKTHDMNRVVKAVFGDDRRRVSAYAAALKVALTAGSKSLTGESSSIEPSELSAWITRQGGIEEIRKVKNNVTVPMVNRAEKAQAAVQATPLTTFKPKARELSFDTDDIGKPQVLVVTYRSNGELEINCVIKTQSVIQAALVAYYGENKAELQQPAIVKAALTATGAALEQAI